MTKVIHCRDLGFDCDGVVRGETEDEVLRKVAAHAKDAHALDKISPEVVAHARTVMREDGSSLQSS